MSIKIFYMLLNLPKDIIFYIFDYLIEPKYKFLDCIKPYLNLLNISIDRLYTNPRAIDILDKYLSTKRIPHDSSYISLNPNAIDLLRKYPDMINWHFMCQNSNPKAIELIEENKKNIVWSMLCSNPNAIHLIENTIKSNIDWSKLSENPNAINILENNIDMIDWFFLSKNKSVGAMRILEKHIDRINWTALSENPYGLSILMNHMDKINWHNFCMNPSSEAISILKSNPDKINWDLLSSNNNDHVKELLSSNMNEINWVAISHNKGNFVWKLIDENWEIAYHKINWNEMSSNPNIVKLFDKYWDLIKNRINYRRLLNLSCIFEIDKIKTLKYKKYILNKLKKGEEI